MRIPVMIIWLNMGVDECGKGKGGRGKRKPSWRGGGEREEGRGRSKKIGLESWDWLFIFQETPWDSSMASDHWHRMTIFR